MEKLLFIGNNSGGMFDFRGMLLLLIEQCLTIGVR